MLDVGWPYRAANWPVDRKFELGMPASTSASSNWMLRSLRTNDTVTGVSAGVLPKTVAPGSVAASIPEGTAVGELGLVPVAAVAPGANAKGTPAPIPTPSSIPTISRAFLIWTILCTVLFDDRDHSR